MCSRIVSKAGSLDLMPVLSPFSFLLGTWAGSVNIIINSKTYRKKQQFYVKTFGRLIFFFLDAQFESITFLKVFHQLHEWSGLFVIKILNFNFIFILSGNWKVPYDFSI